MCKGRIPRHRHRHRHRLARHAYTLTSDTRDFLARMSVSVSMSVTWNAALTRARVNNIVVYTEGRLQLRANVPSVCLSMCVCVRACVCNGSVRGQCWAGCWRTGQAISDCPVLRAMTSAGRWVRPVTSWRCCSVERFSSRTSRCRHDVERTCLACLAASASAPLYTHTPYYPPKRRRNTSIAVLFHFWAWLYTAAKPNVLSSELLQANWGNDDREGKCR